MMRLQYKQLGQAFCVALLLAATVAITSTRAAFINLTPTTGSNSTTSVALSDLIAGTGGIDGITVGDKNMNGFTYTRDPVGDMPTAAQISVTGFKDPNGNWGITFQGPFQDLVGGGSSDAAIRFDVNIDPTFFRLGWRISDAHLFMNGAGVGPNSSILIDETFLPGSTQSLHTFLSTVNAGASQFSDSTVFNPPLTTLHVTKDILANAANNGALPARATVIDQSFSQIQIPEPTSLVLALVGLLGLAAYRRM